ncbi:MAG: preprotein translocase subunit SecY [Verrucomicrobiales bacterium]|nr:preprotein translocase subunit SecY [Verrucomicrobiales bacterium]
MLSAFANMFKIPELRSRIIFTLAMIAIIRIGAAITLPGVDPAVVQGWLRTAEQQSGDAVSTLLNVFSGGGIRNCAVLALGIMPYISASIMMQLLTAVVPRLSKQAREVGGRQKISQYTRYLTILLCLLQGWLIVKGLVNPAGNPLLAGLEKYTTEKGVALVPNDSFGFRMLAVLVMTAGTMFTMWLGEQITERGIGNGTSLIITVNILSDLPGAIVTTFRKYLNFQTSTPTSAIMVVVFFLAFILSIMAIIALTQATRKVPVQYAKRMVGRKMYGGQSTHLPLRLNYSGIMPIIFASAIISFPPMIISQLSQAPWAQNFYHFMQDNGPVHWCIYAVLIFFFAYFWVATMFQPTQVAEDLKGNGGYIPGVRPGKPTSDFLDFTMTRLTFAGALFLTLVAIIPQILTYTGQIEPIVAQFFGGTSILILVGVLLDLMRQVETHLLQRHYDGFLRKGRIRGRYDSSGQSAGTGSGVRMVWLYVLFAVLIIAAASYYMFGGSPDGK